MCGARDGARENAVKASDGHERIMRQMVEIIGKQSLNENG
jgi:hypothetical protein